MNTQILGLHHVTAMTSSAEKIYHFFTDILGLRLIKKTVNQDDIETYHLFFADDAGSPGTDMTFFDFPGLPKGTKGTNTISRTSFRVKDDAALDYWVSRLGPAFVTVENYEHLQLVLTEVLGFKLIDAEGSFHLFEVGEGGNGASIIVEHREDLPAAQEGYGNVHHLALRVADEEALRFWIEKINRLEFPNSGFVERFYFKSEYFLAATHVLFELATDGPGFLEDETYEHAGEKLSLPPFLEPKRAGIEEFVRPFDTSDANVQRN